MKKLLSVILAILFVVTALPIMAQTTVTQVPNQVRVTYNGETVDFDVQPRIMGGSTMVPLRKIFNLLGAEVEWIGATREVVSVKGSDTVRFAIGSKELYKNGVVTYNMPVPATIVAENGESRTLVPLRAVSESFGYHVDWDAATRTAIIMSPEYKESYQDDSELVIYPEFDERINRDYTYDVSVTQGKRTEKLTVYNHVMQNDIRSRSIGGDLNRRFASFAFSGDNGVRVDIKVKQDFETYTVFPSAKGMRSEFKDGVISVYLDKPEYFGIRLDDDLNSILLVFADYPEKAEDIPDKNGEKVIYIEGWYEPDNGYLVLPNSYTTLYLAPGSVLNARVLVKGQGCKIIGRGLIVDPYENFYEYSAVGAPSYLVTLVGTNSYMDGPTLLDARTYNVVVRGNNTTVKNTKCLSSMLCSDGISVWSVSNANFENCAVYVGDNALVDSATRTTAKNLLLGTTCAALYPQQNVQSATYDQIYVFRAGEGVINNIYNANGSAQRTHNLTIKNLYAVDCPSIPWLFKGRDMGTQLKTVNFENVHIPTPTGNGDIRKSGNNEVFVYENGGSYLFTENYDLKFNDLYMGGKLVLSADELKAINTQNAKCSVSVTSSGEGSAVVSNTRTVNYTYPKKVFIGEWEIVFKDEAVLKDGVLLMPYNEIKAALRSDKSAQTQRIGSTDYVSAAALVASGMAAEYQYADGKLTLTPIYSGGNMLLPDSGEISNFTEAISYQEELTVQKDGNETYFSVKNIRAAGAGITRFITEEVRMYGAGKYRVTFSARSKNAGSIKLLSFTESNVTNVKKEFALSTDWQEFSAEFDMRGILTKRPMTLISITAVAKSLGEFDVRDIKLEKIS